MTEVKVTRLSLGTIYRLTWGGMVGYTLLLIILTGVFSLLGGEPFKFNGEEITGVKALIGIPVGLLIGLIFTGIYTLVFGTLMWLGLLVYSMLRPLTLKYTAQAQ